MKESKLEKLLECLAKGLYTSNEWIKDNYYKLIILVICLIIFNQIVSCNSNAW